MLSNTKLYFTVTEHYPTIPDGAAPDRTITVLHGAPRHCTIPIPHFTQLSDTVATQHSTAPDFTFTRPHIASPYPTAPLHHFTSPNCTPPQRNVTEQHATKHYSTTPSQDIIIPYLTSPLHNTTRPNSTRPYRTMTLHYITFDSHDLRMTFTFLVVINVLQTVRLEISDEQSDSYRCQHLLACTLVWSFEVLFHDVPVRQ